MRGWRKPAGFFSCLGLHALASYLTITEHLLYADPLLPSFILIFAANLGGEAQLAPFRG